MLGCSVGHSCCNTGAFSRPTWVDSPCGSKDTEIVPTECHCQIQPPVCGRETGRQHCPVLCSSGASSSQARLCGLWCLYILTLDIVPKCMPYCIFCHPGGPEMPPSKTVPKVGDPVQHELDLRKILCVLDTWSILVSDTIKPVSTESL